MPKVMIDLDKMERELIPDTNRSLAQMNTVVGSASRVQVPSGLNWGGVVQNLQDCANDIRLFSKWLTNTHSSMKNAINNSVDDIEKKTIDPVTKRE